MVILNKNPYAMPKEDLDQLKVEKLYLQGKPYQKQKQNMVAAVLKGVLGKGKKI